MIDAFLLGLETSELVRALRFSRWGYAALSTVHVAGLAILVGSVLPLNLRLLGLWRHVETAALGRILCAMSGVGLAVALASGAVLFATRASGYAANEAMLIKLVLITVGTIAAIRAHLQYGWRLENAPDRLVAHGVLSSCCWIGALIAGRLIAFTG